MLSLEELFCCVDDFCQGFEPQWERQLLGHGLQLRKRERSLRLSFHHDHSDCLSPVLLPEFQNLLSTEGADPVVGRVSSTGELQPIYRVDTQHVDTALCVSALLFWQL